MEENNNEKRNNATISFTDKSQKEEVQAILHEPHLQKLMPPSVRGKDGKMVLWMARYLRDIVELGVVPDFEREYTVPELGALYFQMKLEYDYWRDMISKTEQLVLHLAKSYGLADAEHPCVFDCKFEGGDSKIIIDLDCQAFSYHSLHSFVAALDQGGGFSIQVSVVNSHIHILYDISHTQGYVSPLDRYRDITELEEAVQEDEPLNYEGDPSGCDYYDNDYPLGEESPEGVADGDVPQDESPVTLAVEQEETDEKKMPN